MAWSCDEPGWACEHGPETPQNISHRGTASEPDAWWQVKASLVYPKGEGSLQPVPSSHSSTTMAV